MKSLIQSLPIFFVVTLGIVSGCAWWDRNFSPDKPAMRSEARGRMAFPDRPVSPEAARAINALLGSAVNAALNGDTAAFVNSLAPEDKNRIAFTDSDRADIASAGNRYGANWNSRFQSSYDWSSESSLNEIFGSNQISVDQEERYAHVVIPASHNMPALTLRVRDLGNNTWRINTRDALTAADIRNQLSTVLADLSSADQSGMDRTQAAQIAAHRVLQMLARA